MLARVRSRDTTGRAVAVKAGRQANKGCLAVGVVLGLLWVNGCGNGGSGSNNPGSGQTGSGGSSAASSGGSVTGAGGSATGVGGIPGGVGGDTSGGAGQVGGQGSGSSATGGQTSRIDAGTAGAPGGTGGIPGIDGGGAWPPPSGKMCDKAVGALPAFKKVAASDQPVVGAVGVVGNPESPDVLYVPQHFSGDVRVIRGGKLQAESLLRVNVRQNPPGREQGLLSIQISPTFTTDHLMYVFYSAADPVGQSVVDEWRLTDATHATFVRKVYDQAHSHWFHNGGALEFGPEKLLYISIGDNNADCGPSCAQQPEGLYGRIRRIDLSAANPNTTGKTFEFGLRNPWRWSFDPLTYDVVIGDVGDGGPTAEKLFFAAKADSEGRNWGWAPGTLDNRTPRGTIATLATNGGTIIGGRVYRGTNPKMAGACGIIFFGHLKGQVYTINSDGSGMTQQTALSGTNDLASFGIDAYGELYMTHMAGQVFRIDAN